MPSACEELGIATGKQTVVCGSLHADEIPMLFSALDTACRAGDRVIIAPRHPAGIKIAIGQATARGWKTHRRTQGLPPHDWRLVVLDTVGELRDAYRCADVAIVGGSLKRHGGHNLFEAVRCGTPVLFGPHCRHFHEDAAALGAATPEAVVRDARALASVLRPWLADPVRRKVALERQRSVLPDGTAVADRYLPLLRPWFDSLGLR